MSGQSTGQVSWNSILSINEMNNYLKNHSAILFVLLLLSMLVLAWLFPASRSIIEITFLLTSFVTAIWVAIAKNRDLYRKGQLTRRLFVRNTILDISAVLLAMALAGLLARTIVPISIGQIGDNLLKILAGIVVGLSIGFGVGVFMKRIRGWVAVISSK